MNSIKTLLFMGFFILKINVIFAHTDNIETKLMQKNDSMVLTAFNNLIIPIELVAYLRSDDSIYGEYLIPANSAIDIMTFELEDKTIISDGIKEKYRFTYYFGDPANIFHDDSYVYRLPFKEGKKYRVSQSQNGKFTHNSDKSRFAIDFRLKVGDPVHAAREGLVVRIQDKFKEHGGKKFIKKANFIMIQHGDGTISSYIHLDYKGVLVDVGDHVEKGQLIGYSGLTGFTRGPHLHFVVHKQKSISVPIFFEGYENLVLKKGKKYKILKK